MKQATMSMRTIYKEKLSQKNMESSQKDAESKISIPSSAQKRGINEKNNFIYSSFQPLTS